MKLMRYSSSSANGRRAGLPLASGYKAVLWSLQGDLEYMVARLGIPHFQLKKGLAAYAGAQLIPTPTQVGWIAGPQHPG